MQQLLQFNAAIFAVQCSNLIGGHDRLIKYTLICKLFPQQRKSNKETSKNDAMIHWWLIWFDRPIYLQANCFPLIRDRESKTKNKENGLTRTPNRNASWQWDATAAGPRPRNLWRPSTTSREMPAWISSLLKWVLIGPFEVSCFFAPSSLFSKDQARQSRKRATGSYSEVSEGVHCLDKPLPVGRVEHTEPLLQSILKSHSVSSLFKLFAIWPLLVQGNGCSSSSPIIIILQILQGQGL